MKTDSQLWASRARSTAAVLAFGLALALPVQAQVTTGFETSSGYTSGASVIGVDDTGIAGSAVWQTVFIDTGGATASPANPQTGELAMRVSSDATQVYGGKLFLQGSGLVWNDPQQRVNFSFGMAISSFSAGTGNQVMVYLGENTVLPGTGKYWVELIFTNGELQLWKGNTSANNSAVSIGSYTTFSNLGEYITFDITVAPVSKTYTSVTLSGTNSSVDLTSSFEGVSLPSYNGTPDQWIQFVVGSNDTVVVDFDNVNVNNISIPEPSTYGAAFGVVVLMLAALRRRRR
ncbi:MAG: hypothetical protein Q7Q73_19455 [Verrucomicrobiota bacterium JB024]|nr:hypothetical protein [Verrucomicrobiota bacterium JB024]